MGLSFTIAAGPHQGSHSRVRVRGTHDHILLSQIRDFPTLEGQVPVFIFTRNRVSQLYFQALGSFFVTSYDLQGYSWTNECENIIIIAESESYVTTDGQSASLS
jgi:hypothetical protein